MWRFVTDPEGKHETGDEDNNRSQKRLARYSALGKARSRGAPKIESSLRRLDTTRDITEGALNKTLRARQKLTESSRGLCLRDSQINLNSLFWLDDRF